ncbi:MAG: phosphoglucosamine mutase, partial [Deltaproteobacteria bacterium]|nr:phosphoglucosamine mutase [Deltaproteobacteria bacterium]
DGDRLIAVDEKGQEISGDQILIICAQKLKEQGRLKNDLLVSTVMSNLGLRMACKKYGIKHHTSRVGDRYVLEDMFRLGAILGGEEAGHTIFLEHHATGDGIITAIQLIAAMVEAGKPLSELSKMMETYPQKLINIEVRSKPEISSLSNVMEVIKQVESELRGEGRVLVRYSGTQNMCRVMVEGPTDEMTQRYCQQIAEEIRKTIGCS